MCILFKKFFHKLCNYINFKITFVHIFLLCNLVNSNLSSEEQPLTTENVKLLENVAKQFQSNIESIRTWQGQAIVIEQTSDRKGVIPINRTTEISFWVDVVNNRRLFLTNTIEETKQTDGGTLLPVVYEKKGFLFLSNDSLCFRRSVIDPKGYVPLTKNDGTTEYVLGNEKDRYDSSILKGAINISLEPQLQSINFDIINNFDPFIVMDQFNTSYVYLFKMSFELMQEGNLTSKYYIDYQPPKISLIIKTENGINSYTMDESLRGCPVEQSSLIPGAIETSTISEYDKIHEIIVPKKVVLDAKIAGIKKTILFKKNVINTNIPDDIFTLKGLGAMRGDSVFDERTQTQYFIDDEQYPLPDYMKGITRPGFFIFRVIIIVLGILLVIVAILIKYRKWKHNAPINASEGERSR